MGIINIAKKFFSSFSRLGDDRASQKVATAIEDYEKQKAIARDRQGFSFKQAMHKLDNDLIFGEKNTPADVRQSFYERAQKSFSNLSKETQNEILDSNLLQRDFYHYAKTKNPASEEFEKKRLDAINKKMSELGITNSAERAITYSWLNEARLSPEYTHDMIKKSNNTRFSRIKADKADIEYERMEKKYPTLMPPKGKNDIKPNAPSAANTEGEDSNPSQGFFRRHWKATAAVGGTVGTGLLAAVGIANMMMSQGGQLSNSNLYNPEQQTY